MNGGAIYRGWEGKKGKCDWRSQVWVWYVKFAVPVGHPGEDICKHLQPWVRNSGGRIEFKSVVEATEETVQDSGKHWRRGRPLNWGVVSEKEKI